MISRTFPETKLECLKNLGLFFRSIFYCFVYRRTLSAVELICLGSKFVFSSYLNTSFFPSFYFCAIIQCGQSLYIPPIKTDPKSFLNCDFRVSVLQVHANNTFG